MKTVSSIPPRERVLEALHYNPLTGIFTWKIDRQRVRAGSVAGTVRSNGRRYVVLDGVTYIGTRLVWFYVHGVWPAEYIDHINRDPSDDRISNLRIATPRQNTWNSRVRKTSGSGVRGVRYDPRNRLNPWRAAIAVNGKRVHLGGFPDLESAEAAFRTAEKNYRGEFASG